MLAPVTHVLPLTIIRRTRLLPLPGKVTVRAGQKVSPNDTVAETTLNADYLLIDIARALGLSADKADAALSCHAGDALAQNDILAGPVGVFRRMLRSPRDGKVIVAGGGQVLLELAAKPFALKAGLPGEVVELIPDRGVTIEATGGLVQAAWGNGKSDFGVLNVLVKDAVELLTTKDIDVSMRGGIVMGGHCESEEVIRMAETMSLRGLILVSAAAALAPAMMMTSLPILILEGFGRRTLYPPAHKLLVSADRRDVALLAENGDVYQEARPELVIPGPATSYIAPPPDTAKLEVGSAVRIIRAPAAGAAGTVTALKVGSVFPGGLKAQAAEVKLDNGSVLNVPVANLEIMQ